MLPVRGRLHQLRAVRQSSYIMYGGFALIGAGALLQVLDIYLRNRGAFSRGASSSEVLPGASSTAGASWFTRNFYDGGFEDKMTRREAALILGVRESATAERIKDAHRRVLVQNHPDMGGSPFIAAKVNEAKELLIKGK